MCSERAPVVQVGSFFCEECYWSGRVAYEYFWSVLRYKGSEPSYIGDDEVPLNSLLVMNTEGLHVCDACQNALFVDRPIFRMGEPRSSSTPHMVAIDEADEVEYAEDYGDDEVEYDNDYDDALEDQDDVGEISKARTSTVRTNSVRTREPSRSGTPPGKEDDVVGVCSLESMAFDIHESHVAHPNSDNYTYNPSDDSDPDSDNLAQAIATMRNPKLSGIYALRKIK